MNKFIENNRILLLGALLPLIVIVFFGLATIIPRAFVEPPKFDLLFATGYFNNNYGVSFQVVNGKLQVLYNCKNTAACNQNYYTNQKLFRFDVKSKTLTEINIPLPALSATNTTIATPIQIPEVANLQINPSPVSPDGYEFNNKNNNNNDLLGLFFYDGNPSALSISKNGYSILIPANNMSFNYYNVKFIGWIISNKGA